MRKSRDREEKASGPRADPESERPREHTAEMADFYRKEKLREGKQSPGPGLRGLVGAKGVKSPEPCPVFLWNLTKAIWPKPKSSYKVTLEQY